MQVNFVTFYRVNRCWCAFSTASHLDTSFIIVLSTTDFLAATKVPGIQPLHVLPQPLNSALVEGLPGLRKEKPHNYTLLLANCGGVRDRINLDPHFPPRRELLLLCFYKYCFSFSFFLFFFVIVILNNIEE